jgi:UDP-glucose 4-epimerase
MIPTDLLVPELRPHALVHRRIAVDDVVEETGADVEIIHEEAKDADARHTHADVSKAGELIDYEPSTDIREGVAKFIDWYTKNREWYEPLVRNS